MTYSRSCRSTSRMMCSTLCRRRSKSRKTCSMRCRSRFPRICSKCCFRSRFPKSCSSRILHSKSGKANSSRFRSMCSRDHSIQIRNMCPKRHSNQIHHNTCSGIYSSGRYRSRYSHHRNIDTRYLYKYRCLSFSPQEPLKKKNI